MEMIAALTAALLLGSSGGITPGPLLTFVISQTLRHGLREGAKVAFVPLLTDSPIIIISLLAIRPLSTMQSLLGIISIIGGLYIAWLAWQTWFAKPPVVDETAAEAPRSIGRGIAVNLLNPNPYVFWFTVGTPSLVQASRSGAPAAAAFLALFFVCLIGWQVAVAALVARSRDHIIGHWYVTVMRVLAVMLAVFAVMRVSGGVKMLD